jgi:hypothetical protein
MTLDRYYVRSLSISITSPGCGGISRNVQLDGGLSATGVASVQSTIDDTESISIQKEVGPAGAAATNAVVTVRGEYANERWTGTFEYVEFPSGCPAPFSAEAAGSWSATRN